MKTRITFILLIAAFFSNLGSLQAQDPRFSQFPAAPVYLNPAMTGVFDGTFRFSANYREQWASILGDVPFRTISAAFDGRSQIMKTDYIGYSLIAMRDEAGSSRFGQTMAMVGASYLKKLGGNKYAFNDQYLIAGAQVGGGQYNVEWSKLWFSRQFNTTTQLPDPDNLGSGEPTGNSGKTTSDFYTDVNAGLMYYTIFDSNKSFYGGIAINHITQPKIRLFDDANESLYMRWVAHFGGEFPITDELSMLPAFSWMAQGPSRSVQVGSNVRYSNHDWRELAIRAGLWWHLVNKLEKGISGDALIFSAVLEIENINIGFSYDINTSVLNLATNSRGAYEVSVIYVQPSKERIKVKCPKF